MTVKEFYNYCVDNGCENYELTFCRDPYVGFVPVEPEGKDEWVYGEFSIKHDNNEVRIF